MVVYAIRVPFFPSPVALTGRGPPEACPRPHHGHHLRDERVGGRTGPRGAGPPASVRVHADGHCVTRSGGRLVIGQPRSDPPPPADPNLILWLDVGTVGGTRAAAGALQVPNRRGAGAFTVDVGGYGTVRQAGTDAVALGGGSPGLVGTWGGAVTEGRWTVVLFLRVDRPVQDTDAWTGAGPVTLLSSPAAGVSVPLPAGGSVPVGATVAAGGPLDGVPVGAPWDAALLGQWRQVCVRAYGSGRTVAVDGFPVASAAGQPVVASWGASTPLVVGAGCPVTLVEVLAWNCTLSEADVAALRLAQRAKWEVPTLTASPLPALRAAAEAAARAPATPLPSAVSPPSSCWFDAQARGTLFRDDAGTLPAVPGGAVRRWQSRVGTLSVAAPAGVLLAGGMEAVSGHPVVGLPGGGGPPVVLGATTGFTVVALWRLRPNGAHPLGAGCARLAPDAWVETLGVDVERALPTPAALGAAAGDVLLGLWMRTPTGTVLWRLGGLGDTTGGGYGWTAGRAAEGLVWPGRWCAVAAGGPPLELAELMVWDAPLADGARRALQAHLAAKWGLPALAAALTAPALVAAVPAAAAVLVAPALTWDALAPGSVLEADGATVCQRDGQPMKTWRTVAGAGPTLTSYRTAYAYFVADVYGRGRPGVFVRYQNCLGAGTLSLFNRAVFAVAAQRYPFECTVLSKCTADGSSSDTLRLVADGGSADPGFRTVVARTAAAGGGVASFSPFHPGTRVPVETPYVCGWQFTGTATALALQQVNAQTGHRVTAVAALPAGLQYAIANQGTVPLAVGNDHRNGVPQAEGSYLFLQELRLYPGPLSAAEIQGVYDHLRAKWNVA